MGKLSKQISEIKRKRRKPINYYYQILVKENFFYRFKLKNPYFHNIQITNLSHTFQHTIEDRVIWIHGRMDNPSDYLLFKLRNTKLVILRYNWEDIVPEYICTIPLKYFKIGFDEYFARRK